jgi:cbb3-type cytochrome oxidase maturation protein
MPGLYLTLPISIIIALVFLGFFIWSVRNGDYEDSETAAERILFDEDQGAADDIEQKSGPGAL